MKLSRPAMFLAIVLLGSLARETSGAEAVDFKPMLDFLKPPQGWALGACSAVAVNSKGEIFLFHRGPHPILCFDANGMYLRSWGDDVIHTAHGLRIDRDGHLWVTDIGKHQVFKFDSSGKLLLTIGNGKPGTGLDQFDRPTDIAFGPKGELFVSDGYGNSRVMKFSPKGELIKSWGTKGSGPGEFNLPHAVILDSRGRVLVGDRENNRIQIFDQDGKFLDQWTGYAPFGLVFDRDGTLFVADGRAHKVLCLDASGKVQRSWGQQGKLPGEFDLPHMLAVDSTGSLFVTEITNKRVQRLVRK